MIFDASFEFLRSHHEESFTSGVSRAISGTLQAAESEPQHAGPRPVFDPPTYLAARPARLHAAERAAAGASAATILAELESLREQTATFAYVRDLALAVRGGRIPAWSLPLTRWLGLVPLARIGARDGRLHVYGIGFDRKHFAGRFVARVLRSIDPKLSWRAQVLHCDNRAEGDSVRAALLQQLPGVVCGEAFGAGSAIAAHAGPGAVVLALMPLLEGKHGAKP